MAIRHRHVEPVCDYGLAIDRPRCAKWTGGVQLLGEAAGRSRWHVRDHEHCGSEIPRQARGQPGQSVYTPR